MGIRKNLASETPRLADFGSTFEKKTIPDETWCKTHNIEPLGHCWKFQDLKILPTEAWSFRAYCHQFLDTKKLEFFTRFGELSFTLQRYLKIKYCQCRASGTVDILFISEEKTFKPEYLNPSLATIFWWPLPTFWTLSFFGISFTSIQSKSDTSVLSLAERKLLRYFWDMFQLNLAAKNPALVVWGCKNYNQA